MNSLTLNGFLSVYMKELSNKNTVNIKKLAESAEKDNERVAEPLLLYSYLCVERKTARRQLVNSCLFERFEDICKSYRTEKEMIDYLSTANDDYGKVYKSYLVKKNASINERDVKYKALRKIKNLQDEKKITSYYVCKTLGINLANYGKFLSGNTNMLSMKNIRRVLDLLGMKKQLIKDDSWLNTK
ncbi:MAG: hypothetical protein PHW77_05690 [Eubacteriales bacterium]|nr:hypothetical protein [Eubacteriales bacterium]